MGCEVLLKSQVEREFVLSQVQFDRNTHLIEIVPVWITSLGGIPGNLSSIESSSLGLLVDIVILIVIAIVVTVIAVIAEAANRWEATWWCWCWWCRWKWPHDDVGSKRDGENIDRECGTSVKRITKY